MFPRFALFVKKRGTHTSARGWPGPAAEAIFFAVCAALGGIALAILIWTLLVPDWRAGEELRRYVPSTAVIRDKRILDRRVTDQYGIIGDERPSDPGAAGAYEYRSQLLIELQLDGEPQPPVWGYDHVGDYTTDLSEVEATLAEFEIGEQYPCWYDPLDPQQVVLVRHRRWWPWLVVVIPASLLVYGAVGLVSLLWRTSTSTELRSAVARRAAGLELLGAADAESTSPTVPSIAHVIDSPGIQYAYRLPVDSSPGWLLLSTGMTCVGWNALVAVFFYQAARSHWQGNPLWTLTWLVVPFVAIGGWVAYLFIRQILFTTGVGSTRLEISDHPLYPGGAYRALVVQGGQARLRWLQVVLSCEERATFHQGTDTRIETEVVYRHVVFSDREPPGDATEPYEREYSFTVPTRAMHSLVALHNEVQWSLTVRGRTGRWPVFERKFPIYVYPPSIRPAEAIPSEAALTENTAP